MLAYTLLLDLCVRYFSTVLVLYFVVGMEQEESNRQLSVKLTPLTYTLSRVSRTLLTCYAQNASTTSISYLMYLRARGLT